MLHHYGGVYMDLDVGCKRRLDPLLKGDWDVILPKTKPVGIHVPCHSNATRMLTLSRMRCRSGFRTT